FPDLPAHRYPEISGKVQAVCKKYDIPYNTGTFAKQYGTVLGRIARFSLPDSVRTRLENRRQLQAI
ncbi:MAG TPA: acyl-CoA desaturase, partial [Marinobacter sp.]|nr:acyl-CoA desaturase [Marinobacter sp.]